MTFYEQFKQTAGPVATWAPDADDELGDRLLDEFEEYWKQWDSESD